ncbi:response regulator receiver domain protein [Leptospira inadai serovar Lyme str. 10]|uniref:Response regulator receiver domain protein n=2 Tax=Leptospira inadai serovar Lyme TaxID=293084 RepID=V6HW13_9LEPT|nr:response regulator [Leptospira inadai]EQA37094.1 response regulator receiver domain protein [Leptospira inadai serovar Lyme str. 10]PNV76612.1 response regulator [Leptospira inadai serovar Lyme]
MKGGIAPSGRPYQVIIAENSKFQAKQLAQILESEGYEVVAFAETGKELINLYKENKKVDLITLDLHLPIMDGFAAFYEIKDLGVLPRILVISEENTPAVIKTLSDSGVMDYIVKPIKREKVLEKANATVRKAIKV